MIMVEEIEHAPGQRAVRAIAFRREIDRLTGGCAARGGTSRPMAFHVHRVSCDDGGSDSTTRCGECFLEGLCMIASSLRGVAEQFLLRARNSRIRASNSPAIGWRRWPFTMGPGSNRCPVTHGSVPSPVCAVAARAESRIKPKANAASCGFMNALSCVAHLELRRRPARFGLNGNHRPTSPPPRYGSIRPSALGRRDCSCRSRGGRSRPRLLSRRTSPCRARR